MLKNLFRNITLVLLSFVFVFLMLEGILRILPVSEGLRTQEVDKISPIAHFQPNRTSTWSRFPNFAMSNIVHSNNYGFINDQNYVVSDPRPLTAIIGDSYIEAAMVPYKQTVHGKLAKELEANWRIYSFGVSGAPLSQYLKFAAFAQKTFHPQKMIFNIVANDFDESLLKFKSDPGFHYFDLQSDNSLKLTRIDYTPSALKKLLRQSRLAMYLVMNLQIQNTINRFFMQPQKLKYIGQTPSSAGQERLYLSRQAVDTFFKLLPDHTGLPPKDILIVLDGLRPSLYTPKGRHEAKGSYAAKMMDYIKNTAHHNQYTVIDLSNIFISDFQNNAHKFEFERDGHWNGYAHGIVAKTLLNMKDFWQ